MVVDVPGNGEVAVVSPVVASWLPAVGANAAGGAVSVMSLSAADDGEGVRRVLVSRHCLSAGDPDDAVRRATLEPRSGGYAYLWAWDADDPLVLETTALGCHIGECHYDSGNHRAAKRIPILQQLMTYADWSRNAYAWIGFQHRREKGMPASPTSSSRQ